MATALERRQAAAVGQGQEGGVAPAAGGGVVTLSFLEGREQASKKLRSSPAERSRPRGSGSPRTAGMLFAA